MITGVVDDTYESARRSSGILHKLFYYFWSIYPAPWSLTRRSQFLVCIEPLALLAFQEVEPTMLMIFEETPSK